MKLEIVSRTLKRFLKANSLNCLYLLNNFAPYIQTHIVKILFKSLYQTFLLFPWCFMAAFWFIAVLWPCAKGKAAVPFANFPPISR